MITFLIILGSIIAAIAGLLLYGRYSMRQRKLYRMKPLLLQLFTELDKQLPQPGTGLVRKQLDYFKWYAQLSFPKYCTINFHFDSKSPAFESCQFERKDEFTLATLWFGCRQKKYSAAFKCYNGYISGMNIRPNPRGIMRQRNIVVAKFKLHEDPMEKLDLQVVDEYYHSSEIFTGLLQGLKSKCEIDEVKKPLPPPKREMFLRINQTKLPEDYLQLLEQTNGFSIDDVTVYGLGHLTQVYMPDGDYFTLADGPGGVLSAKRSKNLVRLKYISVEDESDKRNRGEAFLPALDKFLAIVKGN